MRLMHDDRGDLGREKGYIRMAVARGGFRSQAVQQQWKRKKRLHDEVSEHLAILRAGCG